MKGFFPESISKKQASDTGMAAVLILLLLGFFLENDLYYRIAIPALVVNMIFPMFFYPLAFFWFGFAHFLGTIVSSVLLTVIYVVMVVPVGLFRRLAGKDSLRLSAFKKSNGSVMVERNYDFTANDIEKPY